MAHVEITGGELSPRFTLVEDEPTLTDGYCPEKKKTGGCRLHNLHCGYPDCDKHPVVAPQQPAPASERKANPADAFRNMFAILHNLDRWELEDAGLIASHDEDKWTRFNSNLTAFVLKLDDACLDALYALVNDRQPERYRGIV